MSLTFSKLQTCFCWDPLQSGGDAELWELTNRFPGFLISILCFSDFVRFSYLNLKASPGEDGGTMGEDGRLGERVKESIRTSHFAGWLDVTCFHEEVLGGVQIWTRASTAAKAVADDAPV